MFVAVYGQLKSQLRLGLQLPGQSQLPPSQLATATHLCPIPLHIQRQLQRIQKNVGAQIEQRQVPSLKQLRAQRRVELGEQLAGIKITPDAKALVEELAGRLDAEQLAEKLAALVLAQGTEVGPEYIGLDPRQLERLKNERPPRGPQANYRHYKGGNSRGNYRGNRRSGPPPRRSRDS